MNFILVITEVLLIFMWTLMAAVSMSFNQKGGLLRADFVETTILFILFSLVLRG